MSTGAQWLQTAQMWAFVLWLFAVAAAGFFGAMAWMAGVPLKTARRWLRWSLYPAVVFVIALAVQRLTQ